MKIIKIKDSIKEFSYKYDGNVCFFSIEFERLCTKVPCVFVNPYWYEYRII